MACVWSSRLWTWPSSHRTEHASSVTLSMTYLSWFLILLATMPLARLFKNGTATPWGQSTCNWRIRFQSSAITSSARQSSSNALNPQMLRSSHYSWLRSVSHPAFTPLWATNMATTWSRLRSSRQRKEISLSWLRPFASVLASFRTRRFESSGMTSLDLTTKRSKWISNWQTQVTIRKSNSSMSEWMSTLTMNRISTKISTNLNTTLSNQCILTISHRRTTTTTMGTCSLQGSFFSLKIGKCPPTVRAPLAVGLNLSQAQSTQAPVVRS